MTTYRRLGGARQRREYWLTESAIEMVEGFAKEHGLKKSEAANHLILLALQDTKSIGLSEMMADVVASEMRKQFNRFAKLTAMAALEAGAAKEASQTIYTWILMQEHMGYIDRLEPNQVPSFTEFERLFGLDVNSTEGKQVLTLLNKQKDRFRARSVGSLKKGLSEIYEILAELENAEQGVERPDEPQE